MLRRLMTEDRARVIDRAFLDALDALGAPAATKRPDEPLTGGATLTCAEALALFDDQAASRHVDFAARELRTRGAGFYTIGSSGHEGNAAVAAALRPTDPALLHYRSGGFYMARARQVPGSTPILDVLLGIVAAREESIAGGRHKVFGHKALSISPQTSTIASHLPRAVGLAFAIERAKKLGLSSGTPSDAIVVCSFGDASINHSTAVGAINAACHTSFSQMRLPVLFVCEDNGIGISVPTPDGWVEQAYRDRPGLRYFRGDGCDLVDAHRAATEAARYVRERRRPALLHLRTVRLMGHAGSDLELAYRTITQIRDSEAQDPLRQTAAILVAHGAATPAELRERYERIRSEVARLTDEVATRPRLGSAAEIMAPLAPRTPERVADEATRAVAPEVRATFFGAPLPEDEAPAPLAACINRALAELLAKYPEMLLFGEDVGRKGGVYGVTRGLAKRASVARVFDTLLDEQTILGLALGCAQHGLLPFPEIQYLAYLHNAEDQLRGEASTLSFFSKGQYKNPLVVRIASLAYQKGFGGHFHNDNAIAVLRDIPGIVIATPSRGDDAAAMLHTLAAAAKVDGNVCVFLEPIALYHTRDLYEDGDSAWCFRHAPVPEHVPIGAPRVYGEGRDLLLVTFGNGVPMSLRVARRLEREGHAVRVLDLRWIAPLPAEALVEHARACGRVLIADETRRSGGVSEGVIAALVDGGFRGPIARVTSHDSFIPLGDAANHVLMSEADIEAAARSLVTERG
jgi:2-oxoisovalerate dehydrogenase E1 component